MLTNTPLSICDNSSQEDLGETTMDPSFIISLLSGAAGGNVAGSMLKNASLGLVGNSIAGIAGGGIGGKLLAMAVPALGGMGGGLDIGSIVGQVLGGGVGGGALMWIVSMIRGMMAK
jgi:hypothetical protein